MLTRILIDYGPYVAALIFLFSFLHAATGITPEEVAEMMKQAAIQALH